MGVEPPVLKLEYPAGAQPRYVSAVQPTQPQYPPLQQLVKIIKQITCLCSQLLNETINNQQDNGSGRI